MSRHKIKTAKAVFMERVQSEIKNSRVHFKAGIDWPRLTNAQRE